MLRIWDSGESLLEMVKFWRYTRNAICLFGELRQNEFVFWEVGIGRR